MIETKTNFLHYGRHTIRVCLLPDGRRFPDFRDALRVLCILLGVPADTLERMPETDCPNDCASAFRMLLEETIDRPETQAFKAWLDKKMFGNGTRGWDGETVLAMLRHFGTNVTQEEIFQTMMESPDNYVVRNGNIVSVYQRSTGELLATGKEEHIL